MKLSIIVPVYNSEKTVEKCLSTLSRQTLDGIEIIVINDGSTDKSPSIIEKYAKKFPNKIKYISRENKGIGFTRNEGIKIASGEFLGFVDSDDYITLDMFEKLYKKVITENADIAICNYMIVDDNNNQTKVFVDIPGNTSLQDKPEIINSIDFAPWNKIYKKTLFKDIHFPEKLKYEDLNTIIKVFSKAKKIVKLDDYCYYYLSNLSGETTTIDNKIFDIFLILDDLLKYFSNSDKKIRNQIKMLCCRKLFIYTELSLKNKNINFTMQFLDKVYGYLNNNFHRWKLNYIIHSKSIKSLCLRLLQLNKKTYLLHLNKKIKKYD